MSEPLSPAAALHRIAFLLERERASSYRIKAFRGAARALTAMSDADVAAAYEAGKIGDIPGVGKSSLTVITEALNGIRPEYLVKLEASSEKVLAPGSETVMAHIKGDAHSHTDWSDGGSTIDEMVFAAIELGREYLVITDHSPSLHVAHGLSAERLAKQLQEIDSFNTQGRADGVSFELLKGIEVDILEDGSLDQTPEMLDQLDVRVASVHGKLRSDKATMTKRMLGAIRNPHTTILGHCTGQLIESGRGTRPPSTFDAKAIFEACAQHQVAVEINARPERRDPPDDLIALALDAGCYFSLDSDAHAPGQLDFLQYGAARIAELDIPLERVITTWDSDCIRAFARKEKV